MACRIHVLRGSVTAEALRARSRRSNRSPSGNFSGCCAPFPAGFGSAAAAPTLADEGFELSTGWATRVGFAEVPSLLSYGALERGYLLDIEQMLKQYPDLFDCLAS